MVSVAAVTAFPLGHISAADSFDASGDLAAAATAVILWALGGTFNLVGRRRLPGNDS
jgi:hypothetical protein